MHAFSILLNLEHLGGMEMPWWVDSANLYTAATDTNGNARACTLDLVTIFRT